MATRHPSDKAAPDQAGATPADKGSRSIEERAAKEREAINTADKDMKLPHEHDEGLGEASDENAPPENRKLMEQARRDLEEGRQDTNCLGEGKDDSACPPRPDVAKSRP